VTTASTSTPERQAATRPSAATGPDARHAGGRLLSLDAFRGLAVLGMLLVNEKALGPATPAQLRHAGWGEGVHLADMVFPWFLLIVGIAIPYTAASRRRRGIAPGTHYVQIVRRAAILVALGCLINSSYARRPIFDLGVLQLIGLAYLVAALLYGLPLRYRVVIAAVLLVSHWALIRFLPIPGVGAGVFTDSTHVIRYLDETFLQRYQLAGFIAVAPTSALVLIGTALGDLLRRNRDRPAKAVRYLMGTGLGLAFAGSLWSLDLPFNKPVWTASYVVFTAGWGSFVLGLVSLLTEVARRRAWAFPLVVAGRNAIFAYAAPILFKLHTLREWSVHVGGGASVTLEQGLKQVLFSHLGRVPGGFVYTFGYILLWWLVLLCLYRKRIFLRV
jgi:predicted acyltransferase